MNRAANLVMSAFCGVVTAVAIFGFALDVPAPPKMLWLGCAALFLNEAVRYFKEATEK